METVLRGEYALCRDCGAEIRPKYYGTEIRPKTCMQKVYFFLFQIAKFLMLS